jgi:hypothetical protein
MARGQALALFAMTFLLLTLMVLMTVGVGMTAARRMDLNNAADAAAYAAAVETARTFNAAALLNRAIIAQYVTISSIEAQMAYVTEGHNYFSMAANQFRMLNMSGPLVTFFNAEQETGWLKGGRCGQDEIEVADASYDMWHAALLYMSPNPMPMWPGDQVRADCHGRNCLVNYPRTAPNGWLAESLPVLEERAADELQAVHLSIHELAGIERGTYLELHDALKNGTLAKAIAARANIDSNLTVQATKEAYSELDEATRSAPTGAQKLARSPGFEHGLADAILGTRPPEKLILPAGPPTPCSGAPCPRPDNFPPLFQDLYAFATQVFNRYPGQPFRVSFTEADLTADYTYEPQNNQVGASTKLLEEPIGAPNAPSTLDPGMGYGYGRAQGGKVVVEYDDACAGRRPRTLVSGYYDAPYYGPDPVTHQRYQTVPMNVYVRTGGPSGAGGAHVSYSTGEPDGIHWTAANGIGPMGCHGTHAHYNATDIDKIHNLKFETLPDEILDFVLADTRGGAAAHGAAGAWGQPVLPIFLSRSFPMKGDPWARSFHFGFSSTGSNVDLQGAAPKGSQVMTASAAGVAHYHRRGHLGEPPNLLNPFWRATLQPLEVDHREKTFDPTRGTQNAEVLPQVLGTLSAYPEHNQAKQAYNTLSDKVHGMELQPGINGAVQ